MLDRKTRTDIEMNLSVANLLHYHNNHSNIPNFICSIKIENENVNQVETK